MTRDRILNIIEMYDELFRNIGAKPIMADKDESVRPRLKTEILDHCCYMMTKMRKFVEEDRIDKVLRWLSFIQACLWSTGLFSIHDLMGHNMPEGAMFADEDEENEGIPFSEIES